MQGDKNSECIKFIAYLIELLKPHVIVLEQHGDLQKPKYARKEGVDKKYKDAGSKT